jgi:hypothetical protein
VCTPILKKGVPWRALILVGVVRAERLVRRFLTQALENFENRGENAPAVEGRASFFIFFLMNEEGVPNVLAVQSLEKIRALPGTA